MRSHLTVLLVELLVASAAFGDDNPPAVNLKVPTPQAKKAEPKAAPVPVPPGYPAPPKGFHWEVYPGGVLGLVQDGLAAPKNYRTVTVTRTVTRTATSCPDGRCPLPRRFP